MKEDLRIFIDSMYRQPYRLLGNNCIDKSFKIKARAEELGESVDIVVCWAVLRASNRQYPPVVISPHVFTLINGEKVDVALDPAKEAKLCKNSEQKIVLPVNVSRLWRRLSRKENVSRRSRLVRPDR